MKPHPSIRRLSSVLSSSQVPTFNLQPSSQVFQSNKFTSRPVAPRNTCCIRFQTVRTSVPPLSSAFYLTDSECSLLLTHCYYHRKHLERSKRSSPGLRAPTARLNTRSPFQIQIHDKHKILQKVDKNSVPSELHLLIRRRL